MDPSKHQHPVIDTLEKTRLDHHEEPFPHSSASAHRRSSATPLDRVGSDVTDQVLQQAEAVPLSGSTGAFQQGSRRASGSVMPQAAHPVESSSDQPRDKDGNLIGLSTTATLPSSTWQSLASKSSNQLPSRTIVGQMAGPGDVSVVHEHEDQHDKPSVLPEILPGFKGRMADIHNATLKSVTDGGSSSSDHDNSKDVHRNNDHNHGNGNNNNSKGEGQWTGGTMFPTMTGFSNPFSNSNSNNNNNYNNNNNNSSDNHQRSASEEANRKLAKNSILYESSDLTESTTKLTDEEDDEILSHQATAASQQHPSSKTMVQGGQGGRRWSHELSPEKAGLVGSVVEAAGLLKDVVLDKIQQRPPSSGSQPHVGAVAGAAGKGRLSTEEKIEAAKVAFGGSEELGDQTIYLEGLDDHLRHEQAQKAAAEAASTQAANATTSAKALLGSAPDVALEHRRSVFHMAANPETKKSMLLDHPESLGYHARDPTLAFEESSGLLTAQHRAGAQQDVSKTSR